MTSDIKKVMASFFFKQMMIQELMVKFRKFRKTIDMMIKKIQNRPESFRAKHEIIVNAFEREKEELQQKVMAESDQSMKAFIGNLNTILPEVRDAAISRFLKKCEEKYAIAFFQWRWMFRPEKDNAEHTKYTKELLMMDLEIMASDYKKEIDITKKPTEKTLSMAAVSLENESKYGFLYDDDQSEIQKR